MEFKSREEILAYEKEREDYYMQFLNAKSVFELYKLWFREIFVPKYRKLKKKYDGYCGGWYRDKNGVVHTNSIDIVDSDKIECGTICIVDL